MESLTSSVSFNIFMDNYFDCLPYNIRAKRVLNKNRLRKCSVIGDKQPQEKEYGHFNQCMTKSMDENVTKYWYPNEKMVVVPVCLNGTCCSSGCVGIAWY